MGSYSRHLSSLRFVIRFKPTLLCTQNDSGDVLNNFDNLPVRHHVFDNASSSIIPSRFSSNSEVHASELLENLEGIVSPVLYYV